MDNPVAHSVASALGLTSDQGQAVVELLVKHLHSQVLPTRAVSVPDLGTFFLEGGQLGFQADAALNAAIGGSLTRLEPVSFALEEKGRPSWLRVVAITACIVLIGVLGYFGYTRFQAYQDLPGASEVDALTGEEAEGSVDEPALPVQEEPGPDVQPEPANALRQPEAAALAAGEFTLVVASLADDSTAQAFAAEFRGRVDNVLVRVLISPDSQWFRVAVGQSATYEGILQLKNQLPDLPAESWPLEIE